LTVPITTRKIEIYNKKAKSPPGNITG